MRKIVRGLVVGLSVLTMMTFTGCSYEATDTVATLDEQEIELGFANFYARYSQITYENYYSYYAYIYGESFDWGEELDDGSTYEETAKDNIMDEIEELYILDNHKDEYDVEITDDEMSEIEEYATKFMDSNDEDGLNEIGATQEYVEEFLRLMLVKQKMTTAITADVDTEVTDEEKNQSSILYVKVDTDTTTDDDGNEVELTDEDVAELKDTINECIDEIHAGGDFETVFSDAGYTANTGTYGSDDESLPDELKEATDALAEGETSDLIEIDDAFYVGEMVSIVDEDATADKEASIISDRETEMYDTQYEEWQSDSTFKVKSRVWASVEFNRSFEVVTQTDDETSDETED